VLKEEERKREKGRIPDEFYFGGRLVYRLGLQSSDGESKETTRKKERNVGVEGIE